MFCGIISSCDECNPSPDKFKISSLNSEMLQINILNEIYKTESLEVVMYKIKLSEIESKNVSYKEYSIRMSAEMKTYFAYKGITLKNIFIERSYACSPATPTTDEKITNIEIFANKDYNSSNKAGQNISHLFDVLVLDYNNSSLYYTKFDLKEYINSNPIIADELIFILKEAPENTSNYKFEIKYYQDGIDLNSYNFETNEIEIRKN